MFSLHVFFKWMCIEPNFDPFWRKWPEFWSCLSVYQKCKTSTGDTRWCLTEVWMATVWLGSCTNYSFPVGRVLQGQPQLQCPHCTWWSPFVSRSPLTSSWFPALLAGACPWPVFRLWCAPEHSERLVVVLSAGCHHSDRWDCSQVHEESSLSVGMQIHLEGACKASFGNNSQAQRCSGITRLSVTEGAVHNN